MSYLRDMEESQGCGSGKPNRYTPLRSVLRDYALARRTTGVQSTPRTTGVNSFVVSGRSTVHGGCR